MAERYAHLAPENLQETMSIPDASRLRHAHVGDPEAGNKSTDASP